MPDTKLTALANITDINAADQLYVEQGGVSKAITWDDLRPKNVKAITIVDIVATDDATFLFTTVAITVIATHAHRVAGTNVVYNVKHAPNRDDAGLDVFAADITLTSTEGQTNAAGFDDATIPANSWVWLDVVSVSGSVTMFGIVLGYNED